MAERLDRWGVKGTVIDVTPVLHGDEYAYKRRGCEIQQWLQSYTRHPVESFVILDDDNDMGGLSHRLVRTSMEAGLTPEHADRAIAILNASPTDMLIDRMLRECKVV